MSVENWKKIWASRKPASGKPLLQSLIELDGFDSDTNRIDVSSWQCYVDSIVADLEIGAEDSVYEVGCGSGAFLYALQNSGRLPGGPRVIAGLDYSPALIDVARTALPSGHFECMEAAQVNVSASFDFVIANSVFHYFPLEYAKRVLESMCQKAGRAVALLELPDALRREESEAFRRGTLSQGEYERKYSGLSHTYYDRAWVQTIAVQAGLECRVFEQSITDYPQNKFRFNAILKKAGLPRSGSSV